MERANRTHREEFFEVENIGLKLEAHNHSRFCYLAPATLRLGS